MEWASASRGHRLRTQLFELYSSHLASFAEDDLHFEVRQPDGSSVFPPLGEFYICPLCLGCFHSSALNEPPEIAPLTIEDVPPKSVARSIRKVKVLTCKTCNSRAGSQSERHLEELMAWNDFEPGHTDDYRKCKLQIADAVVQAHLTIKQDKAFQFKVVGDAAPRGRDAFFEGLRDTFRFAVSMRRPDMQCAKAALLKSAFLLAFASFGYSYILFSPSLAAVARRIAEPESDSVPDDAFVPLDKLPDGLSSPSISIVQEPSEFQSLLVLLTLRRFGKDRIWGVSLPGPGTKDDSLYQALRGRKAANVSIRATQILAPPPGLQYPIREPASRHLIHRVWKELCG